MKRMILFFTLAAALMAQSVGTFKNGGQQAVTGTAAKLPSFLANVTCIKVVPAGTQVVYIGNSTVTTSNGYPLSASDSVCFPAVNLNQIYVVAASTGSTVAWFGTSTGQ